MPDSLPLGRPAGTATTIVPSPLATTYSSSGYATSYEYTSPAKQCSALVEALVQLKLQAKRLLD